MKNLFLSILILTGFALGEQNSQAAGALAFSAATSTVAAGVTQAIHRTIGITVVVKTAGGVGIVGCSVSISSSRGGSDTLATNPTLTGVGGSAVFTVFSDVAGTAVITATVTANAACSNSGAITQTGSAVFTAGAASAIAISSGNNQIGTAGSALSSAFVAVVTDAYSNVISGTTVTWSVTSGGGSVSSASGSTNGSGLASSTLTLGTTAGTNTVTATSTTAHASVTFTATGATGSAASIAIATGNNQSINWGDSFSTSLQVLVKDSNNNPVAAGTKVDWDITVGDGSVDIFSLTDSNGYASTSLIPEVTYEGTYTVTATVHGTAFTVSFSATITHGLNPASVAVSNGDTQSAVVTAAYGTSLEVYVDDGNGYPFPGATINWTEATGGVTFSASSSVTNSSGLATISITAGTVASDVTIYATEPTTSNRTTFTATITAGAAAAIAVSSGNSQSATAGSALTNPFVAVVTDTYGNLKSGSTVNWAVTAGSGTLSSASSASDASGLSSTTLTTGTTAGTNTVTATVNGTAYVATFTATGVAGAAASIAVSSGNNQSGTAGSAVTNNFVAVVKDANNNVVSGATVDWAILTGGGSMSSASNVTGAPGTSSSKITLGTTAGSNTASATVNGTAFTVTFTATGVAGAAASIAVSSGNNQSGSTSTALSNPFIAVVKDANNNVVSGATVDWAITAGGGSLSSASSATDASGLSSSTLTLGAVAGANTATATVNGTAFSVTFTATGTATTAAKVAFTTQPSANGTANTVLAQQPVVTVQTAGGATVTGSSATITLTLATDNLCANAVATGTIANPTQAASSGVATFTTFRYTKSGVYYIKASSGALTTACSTSVTLAAPAANKRVSCATLAGSGYTVDVTSATAAGSTTCASNQIMVYSKVHGVPTPTCVNTDCGLDAQVCRSVSTTARSVYYYCASH